MAALAVLSVAAMALSQSCTADERRGTATQQADCMADVFRLCSGDIPDETAILACLQSKAARLSAACHRVIEPAPPSRG